MRQVQNWVTCGPPAVKNIIMRKTFYPLLSLFFLLILNFFHRFSCGSVKKFGVHKINVWSILQILWDKWYQSVQKSRHSWIEIPQDWFHRAFYCYNSSTCNPTSGDINLPFHHRLDRHLYTDMSTVPKELVHVHRIEAFLQLCSSLWSCCLQHSSK